MNIITLSLIYYSLSEKLFFLIFFILRSLIFEIHLTFFGIPPQNFCNAPELFVYQENIGVECISQL